MTAPPLADEKLRERLLREVPARRAGNPEELGPLVVYLASSASDFMTGETIFIDGGQLAGGAPGARPPAPRRPPRRIPPLGPAHGGGLGGAARPPAGRDRSVARRRGDLVRAFRADTRRSGSSSVVGGPPRRERRRECRRPEPSRPDGQLRLTPRPASSLRPTGARVSARNS